MAAYNGSNFFQPFSVETTEVAEEPFIEPPQLSMDNRDVQEQLEKNVLYDDMLNCGVHPENHLSVDELCSKLQKSKRNYSEEAVRRIFGLLASYQSSLGKEFVNGKQFIEGYMKRKRELNSVLDNTSKELDIIDKMLQQSEANLRKFSGMDPKMGDESKLTVQVVSVQNVPQTSGDDPISMYKIHLECQHQVIDTRPVYQSSGFAFFNEMFSFQISTIEGDLRAKFVQVEPFSGKETSLGDCSIMVEDLGDQRKHELTKEIWGAQNAELLLSCQWIFSKKRLYQQYLREFSSKREQKLKDLAEYQAEHSKLIMPFVVDNSGGIGGFMMAGPEYVSIVIDQVMHNMKLTNWQVASQYLVNITFVLVCIASYSRCLFLDQVILAFAFWCNLDTRRWSLNKYLLLIGAIILSMILDVAWMDIYFEAWTLHSIESDLHMISKVSSFFLLMWKVVMILFFWKCWYDTKKKTNSQNLVQQSQAYARQVDMHERQQARVQRMDRVMSQNAGYSLVSNPAY